MSLSPQLSLVVYRIDPLAPRPKCKDLPAKCSQDEVHYEKSSHENQGDKVQPRPGVTEGVINLVFGWRKNMIKGKNKNKNETKKSEVEKTQKTLFLQVFKNKSVNLAKKISGCACAESKKKDTLQSYFEPQVQKFLEWLLVTSRRSQEHFREKLKPGLLRSHQRL